MLRNAGAALVRAAKLLIIWIVILETIGLIGSMAVWWLATGELPLLLLPHPIRREIPQSSLYEFDPNLGWYPQNYRFGRPRTTLAAKTPSEYRIFLLGGSTVEGDGATREEETIAKRLEDALNASGAFGARTVTVYNKGISGYYSKQELLLLASRVLPFQEPDMILVLDGVNDFLVNSVEREALAVPYSDLWHYKELSQTRAVRQLSTPQGAVTNGVLWGLIVITRKTFIGTFLDYLVRVSTGDMTKGMYERVVIAAPPLEPSHAVPDAAVQYYLENILMMEACPRRRVCRFSGFPSRSWC